MEDNKELVDVVKNKWDEIPSDLKYGFLWMGFKIENREKIEELNEKISCDPENFKLIFERAELYKASHQYLEAIKDYTKLIEVNHTIKDAYKSRAYCYLRTKSVNKALEDFNKLAMIYPHNIDSYSFAASCFFYNQNFENAKNYYSKAIEIYPDNSKLYVERAICSSKSYKKDYESALIDYSKAIELEPENVRFYRSRADLYFKMNKYIDALDDLNKAISIGPENKFLFKERGKVNFLLKEYNKALNDVNTAIEIDPETCDSYLLRGDIYREMQDYESALKNYDRVIAICSDEPGYYLHRAEVYGWLDRYEIGLRDLNKCIELDPDCCEAYGLRAKFNKMLRKFDAAKSDIESVYICHQKSDVDGPDHNSLREDMLRDLQDINEAEVAQAKIDEKNKIIADLSHSIKNLISTVIDPLESLKGEDFAGTPVIKNALKGANLIREIVNAVNLSFTGSIDDFFYDAKHNSGKDAMGLRSIIVQSIIYSISHMFDGKYFSNFLRQYFPERSFFEKAKLDWLKISQCGDVDDLILFLNQYFFNIDIVMPHSDEFVMGNEKGSAIKLLILFQELIFNAVKYSAFIDKASRFLNIHFENDLERIKITVQNKHKKTVKAKSSGIGLVIIDNFSKLLQSKPIISIDNDIYSVEIAFVNFWKEGSE